MRNWIRHIDALISNLIVFNWRHHLQKVAVKWSDEELAEKMKSIPSKERQEAWLRVARKPYPKKNGAPHALSWSFCSTRWRMRRNRAAGWLARPIR
jgi:glutathione S-transferase